MNFILASPRPFVRLGKLAVSTDTAPPTHIPAPVFEGLEHVLRHLFLIGYDIRSHRLRRQALRQLKGHAVGGQKSLYECWMTVGELQQAMAALRRLIDPETDRVVFVRLDPRATVRTLGVAVAPPDDDFFYAG